eukprot:CAMPEP_0168750654 /NCGR_PEP_ID=MMETSP0724-20121128/17396_1 /TAXON_ID=265536 /ORGANISM="Amphiprora sp., Strain CCMP467" /LENGTH=103 /DNA_ID=CAMNT_0008798707 /DNA_START=53 /DNA_END=364 /DNA_ORIENTATION=+
MTETSNSNGADEPLFDFRDEKQKQNFFYSVLWILVTLFFVFPLASFLSPFWLILQIFEPFLPVLREATSFMDKFMTWPRKMGLAIYESRETFPNPLEETPTSS